MQALTHIPAGEPIPGSAHSVSVSIPDIESVIGFESRDEATLRRIPRGYPRFRRNPFAEEVARLVGSEIGRDAADLVLTCSERAAREAAGYAGVGAKAVVLSRGVSAVVVGAGTDQAERVRAHVQHTGTFLSSRASEDVLLAAGLLDEPYPEEAWPHEPEARVAEATGSAYGAGAEWVSTHNTGMNGIASAVAAVDAMQQPLGRRRWIELGWIFFDTVKLFEKGIVAADATTLPAAYDVDALAAAVRSDPGNLAGIVAEVPSNPLLQVPDLDAVRELADEAGAAVVMDSTIATPHNVDVLRYADVACESLTKYATGSADVLMGVTTVNPASRFARPLLAGIRERREPPYVRDAARVAHRMEGYAARMRQVNHNAIVLAEAVQRFPAVRHVHWPYEERSEANYRKLERPWGGPGGLLMLDLGVPLERVYDRLSAAKGPSFGAEITMVSPQVFVAHFDLLCTPEGRDLLLRHELHRNMLRVSVGTEPPDRIVAVFEDALAGVT